ncbi:sigma-70 family RNA polymerase sigma factor [Paraburkholderia acidisoli]|uniref:Sigma-70 family RNA polymerase sigma factor n=1 Tax=Paraburkholderia acidisoli TaxID=2571748 RepID=A0A7Z2GI00_9BURK|nr:sigma-70 family RNA polymerase sigma factor [Paraburkholderia acidisoli]QGZ62176.1 sigma-70 family RNA polymerase sigma factor [Paraburkholderia acidisoli]
MDAEAIDAKAPGAEVFDISTPDVSTPDVATPDEATPDVSTPDVSTPDVSAPDEATRAAVFDAARARLLALATRVLGSRAEAEDVVQDAWFRWRDADAQAVRTPQAWLSTVTVRLAIDRLRRLRREQADGALERVEDSAPSAEETGLLAARLSDGLLMLMERLAPLEQAVFVLREGFDCDYAQIAALTGCTNAHCRQIVRRAHLRLARVAAAPPVRSVPSTRPVPAQRTEHARTVERLRDVLREQDRAGLMDLLGVTATALVAASAETTVVAGASAAANAASHGVLRAEALAIGERDGVALVAANGELAAWLHVRDDRDGAFEPVVCVAGWQADKSGNEGEGDAAHAFVAANRAFGGAAVRALLAKLNARTWRVSARGATSRAAVEQPHALA